MNCHAYPIIDMAESAALGEKIIRIRNPWHVEKYYGDYSDLAANRGNEPFPDAWKEELGPERAGNGANDGEFWMKFTDFFKFTNFVTHNWNVENWHHDYHLMLDVPDQDWRMDSWYWCGEECSGFNAKVVNKHTDSQTIWVGMHTWDARTYGGNSDCNQRNGGMHAFQRVSPW